MTGIMIVLFGIAGLCFGWFVYSKFIAEKIFKLDPDFRTPAHEFNDGTDFVPTNKYVLWGHHFTSVAGAAPIVGPAIAVYWGWAPALLWVVFGTIFFAGIHDKNIVPKTTHKRAGWSSARYFLRVSMIWVPCGRVTVTKESQLVLCLRALSVKEPDLCSLLLSSCCC